MSDYKNTAFEFNDRVSRTNSDCSNMAPYTIPKLVIPSDEFVAHQSFWSCSSSQSGSTEAEDDSRVDRDKHSESFRLSEEHRPAHQPPIPEDGFSTTDPRRYLGKSAAQATSFHYGANVHSDVHNMNNGQYMTQSSAFVNQQVFAPQERFPNASVYNRKVEVSESPRVASQYNVNMFKQVNSDGHHQFADTRQNIRFSPTASQGFYPQMNVPSHQARQYQNMGVNLSRPNDSIVGTNLNYAKPPVSPLSSTYHTHASQGINSLNGMIYQVQFKCTFRHFILGVQQLHSPICVGEFVVVEADRGEDIGIVTDILPMKTFVERRIYMKASVEDDNVIGRIVRIASVAERQFLPEKFHDEDNILQFCRELSHSTYRLPMVIHDVEYQFDRHKLTVYYAADSRVDFREFVRDLFSAYKARIWMKKLNTQRPIKLENWATVALATGMQFSPDK